MSDKIFPQVVSRLTQGFTYAEVTQKDLGISEEDTKVVLVTFRAGEQAVQYAHYSDAGTPVCMQRASKDGVLETAFVKAGGAGGEAAAPEVTKKEFTELSEKVTKLESDLVAAKKDASDAKTAADAAKKDATAAKTATDGFEARIAALEAK